MWRDSSASTSMAKPNAWGTSEISRRSQFNNSEVQSPSASNNTNGGHIPSSNASSSINSGPTADDRLSFGRIFTTEDMTERVLFGKSGLEGAMERLTVVSVNLNCGLFSLFIANNWATYFSTSKNVCFCCLGRPMVDWPVQTA